MAFGGRDVESDAERAFAHERGEPEAEGELLPEELQVDAVYETATAACGGECHGLVHRALLAYGNWRIVWAEAKQAREAVGPTCSWCGEQLSYSYLTSEYTPCRCGWAS